MRGKSKTVLAICMAMCLAVAAPLSCYRIESKAVVAEAIALSAATLAITYLAASGINYIFNGMESGDAKTYLNGKITEYTSEVQEPPPLTNFKISKLGAIVIGASLAQWLSGFANWLVGTDTASPIPDNTVTTVHNTGGGNIELINSERIVTGSVNRPSTLGEADAKAFIGESLYNELRNTSGEYTTDNYNSSQIISVNSDISISIEADYSYYNAKFYVGGNQVSGYWRVYGGSNADRYRTLAIIYNVQTDQLFVAARYDTSHAGLRFAPLANNYTYIDTEGQTVDIKTGVKAIPQVVADTDYDVGIEIKQPAGVATVGVGADAVPYPLTDAQVWENIMDLVAANTAQAVAYAPTYDEIETFPAVVDINTDAYDIPLTDEELSEVTAVGDLSTALDLINDALDWFLGLFNWDTIKTKFPFSVPYDVWLLFSTFTNADYDVLGGSLPDAPVENAGVRKSANNAPVYQMQVPYMYDTNHNIVYGTVTLDFSVLDPIRPMIRAGFGILFTAVLLLFIV